MLLGESAKRGSTVSHNSSYMPTVPDCQGQSLKLNECPSVPESVFLSLKLRSHCTSGGD